MLQGFYKYTNSSITSFFKPIKLYRFAHFLQMQRGCLKYYLRQPL